MCLWTFDASQVSKASLSTSVVYIVSGGQPRVHRATLSHNNNKNKIKLKKHHYHQQKNHISL